MLWPSNGDSMKEKYIEELVGRYYLFPKGEDRSDIATSKSLSDIAHSVPTVCAEELIKDRDLLVDALLIAIKEHGENADKVLRKIRCELYTK